MISSGRCHGPNCTREATDGPWCAPACRTAWHDQFHWLYGDGRVQEPVIVREVVEPPLVVHEDGDRALAAALDAAQPQLEQRLAAVIQAADPPPASTFTVAEVARIAASLPRTGETAKLTEEQFWALTHSFPDRPGWQPNGQPGAACWQMPQTSPEAAVPLADAAYQQVAPVPVSNKRRFRAFHWLFGRTT